MLRREDRPQIELRARSRLVAGSVWIDLEGRQFALAGSGGQIWIGLTRGASPAEIAAELSARHGVPLEQVEADVAEFLVDLTDKGLVRSAHR